MEAGTPSFSHCGLVDNRLTLKGQGSIHGTDRNIVTWMTTENGSHWSFGPISNGRFQNLTDIGHL